MILSDRPRGAAPAVRRSGVEPAALVPKPKASCAGCGRPVAMARTGKCVYCGRAIEAPASEVVPAIPSPAPAPAGATPTPALPPEVLIALEPRAATSNSRRLWTLRIGAAALVLLALLLMVAMSGGKPE